MNSLHLLADKHLLFTVVLAAAVSLLTTLNVAARPAAVETRRVALAFSLNEVFFMVTRFANLFYLPLLAIQVDTASRTGDMVTLYAQIRLVVMGASFGALAAWVLLPTFIELYRQGVFSMEYRKSMLKVLLRSAQPSVIAAIFRCLRRPSMLGVRLFHLEGIPADFLLINVAATAVWTAGALCAMMASAIEPQYKSTAVLLSGLVNAFAAIAFSVFVDPKAALITDQTVAGERPDRHVRITAVHLSAGNYLGATLGVLVLWPGTQLILWASRAIGSQGGSLVNSLWIVVALNAFVTLLASTTIASRVSAVITGRVATAMAVYNLFFLVTRITQQIYAPVLGTVRDYVVNSKLPLSMLENDFRRVILGATIGTLLGCLLLPTFIEIYNATVRALDRLGSIPALFKELLKPRSWGVVLHCLRPPSTLGVKFSDMRAIPRGFLWGNLFVISIYTIGMMAAIQASAMLDGGLARTATLLSSVVNGLATIAMSVIVSPTTALIVDQCVHGKRPVQHIYATVFFLIIGMLLGTILSQVLFEPATWMIMAGAHILQRVWSR